VAFACVISFMGIGLVDPILPAISKQLQATPSQVSLLFTSYLVVTAVAMLFTGAVSSRIGAKRTLIAGLALVVVFAALAGSSGSISGIVGFRAGWGLGNALFISTSLAVIVASATGGFAGAIILYEAALGFGIAVGPLLGGLLGNISWRGPFFGVSVLMLIAMVATAVLVEDTPRPARPTSVLAPLKALRHRSLLVAGLAALCYNWGFFTLLGYAPYPMELDAIQLGFVFFAWGLLVALFSVVVAPRLQARFGTGPTMYAVFFALAIVLGVIAYAVDSPTAVIVATITSGAFIGINNTLMTQAVMELAPVARPVASSAYGFLRFIGGGLAPFVAGKLADHWSLHVPFWVGSAAFLLAIAVLATMHGALREAESGGHAAPAATPAPATVTAAGADARDGAPVVVAVGSGGTGEQLVAEAARIARLLSSPLEVVRVRETEVVEEVAVDEGSLEAARAEVDALVAALQTQGVVASGLVLEAVGRHSSVGTVVAAHANRVGARLVACGAPSAAYLGLLTDGSVTTALAREAQCSVLLLRPAADGRPVLEGAVPGRHTAGTSA
jgi:MFS family permease